MAPPNKAAVVADTALPPSLDLSLSGEVTISKGACHQSLKALGLVHQFLRLDVALVVLGYFLGPPCRVAIDNPPCAKIERTVINRTGEEWIARALSLLQDWP
jgi:hypothetical protein